MQKEIVKYFQSLSYEEILAQRPGKWGDYELLEPLQYFDEEDIPNMSAAVSELILRSPEHGEMVDYGELYWGLMEYERRSKNYPAALRWAHAGLAYVEQHYPGLNRANWYRDIAEIYLQAGALDDGLAIMARCLEAEPDDTWTYNSLGIFLPDAGLSDLAVEMLDRALERIAEEDPEKIQEQLETLQVEARERAAGEKNRLAEVKPDVLERLRAAMQLSSGPPEGMNAYLPPVDGLFFLDEDGDETLYGQIMAQGKVLAPDLIRLAFDEALRETPALGHAVALLRRLKAEMAIELAELAPWLARAHGDWQRELLTQRAGKIGGYTTDELVAIAADTDYHLLSRTEMVAALRERAQKCPEQRERIVQEMRTLLTRPEAYEADEEAFIGFLIIDIEDMGAKELYPEIETAFAEDRVDPTITGLQSVQETFDLPVTPWPKRREDGLYLLLECKECGRVREHFVQHVMVDTFTQEKVAAGKQVKYDPFVMDREIICPKCGARDQYEVTPLSSLRLMMPDDGLEEWAALLGDQTNEPKFKPHSRVNFFGSVAFNRPMHPLEALDRYKKLIAADSKNVSLYMRMGSLLRTIRRYPQSLEALREGYELGTKDPEDVINLAMAEHDFGDQAVAKELYEETIRLTAAPFTLDPYLLGLADTARRGLKLLKRGKASPWQPDWIEEPESESKPKPSWHRKRRRGRPKKKKGRR
jgi:tetratricopeptide (TPR) repeat protein